VAFLLFLARYEIPSNQYLFLPDPAHPVAPLVTVAGGHEPQNGGGIYFVDVVIRKASLLEKELFPHLNSGADLVPANKVVPPGVTTKEQSEIDRWEMRNSQSVAAAVALRALGKKVTTSGTGALVTSVADGFPASGHLQPTDVVVALDGHPIKVAEDLTNVMRPKSVGSRFRFTVLRNGKRMTVDLRTVAATEGPHRGIVGITVVSNRTIHLPIKVSIDAHGVGGPSAGLAFALEVTQQLGRDVDRGRKVAATGEIFFDGSVGPIGGVRQKTLGALKAGVDLFLVPTRNAAEARTYAKGMRIVPVKSFQQALRFLATLPVAR